MFNATFNNISVIMWRPVLLVEETGVPGENNRTAASRWQTLSNYHTVMTTTAPSWSKDKWYKQILTHQALALQEIIFTHKYPVGQTLPKKLELVFKRIKLCG
jgi:hypothetical protein